MNIQELYRIYLQCASVQTDTRKLAKDDLFFALKGPSFNGNEFAAKALELGAICCVVDEDCGFEDERLFKVDDVLEALQSLAKFHREKFSIPFIAITGSNGKTTTKELVHAVLSAKYITYTTEGNLNNHIGIPLTILKIKPDAEMAVIEMGANHQREIAGYCEYTLPTHGIITNCGKAHLEGFGGEEGVRKGKGELYDFIRAHDGMVFVNADDFHLMNMSNGIANISTYGSNEGANCRGWSAADNVEMLQVVIHGVEYETDIATRLVGNYNLPNVLVAAAIGKHFGIAVATIKHAIEGYEPSNSRSQMLEKDGNQIVLDAYNANPSSMKLAIENFARMPGVKKILMIGGMMELGEESEREHKQIIELIREYSWHHVVLVGHQFDGLAADMLHFENAESAGKWYRNQAFSGFRILLKGSRSMKMEKVLE
jgi:UDP-N-acetylmuramoyl-tripeptide--D-alanyl-D-alanine ligase